MMRPRLGVLHRAWCSFRRNHHMHYSHDTETPVIDHCALESKPATVVIHWWRCCFCQAVEEGCSQTGFLYPRYRLDDRG